MPAKPWNTARWRKFFHRPTHPYTIGLLGAAPRLDDEAAELPTIAGNPPNLAALPPGCPFQARCEKVQEICRREMPPLATLADGSRRACHWHAQGADA